MSMADAALLAVSPELVVGLYLRDCCLTLGRLAYFQVAYERCRMPPALAELLPGLPFVEEERACLLLRNSPWALKSESLRP